MEIWKAFLSLVFGYYTPKTVGINYSMIGLILNLCRIAVIGYVLGMMISEKTYQKVDVEPISASVVQVRGVTLDSEGMVWDAVDTVIPPQENDAFFVTTRAIFTEGQQRSICGEDPNLKGAVCANDTDCEAGTSLPSGNGVMTGECEPYPGLPNTNTCLVRAWCPVQENKLTPSHETLSTSNFTVLIKSYIEFTEFRVKKRNVLDTQDQEYLETCRYDPKTDDLCPVFELGTIVSSAGEDYDEIAALGGIIAIKIDWKCNFDKPADECKPKYSFRRLDHKNASVAQGWNFRSPDYYYTNGVKTRDLKKTYGIRFVILVHGEAGKFYFVKMGLAIASGLGIFVVADWTCFIIFGFTYWCFNCYKQDECACLGSSPVYQSVEPEEFYKPEKVTYPNFLSECRIVCRCCCSKKGETDHQPLDETVGSEAGSGSHSETNASNA